MRKSKDVPLTLLAALALFTTTGCKDTPETRSCVDSVGRLAPEANCQAENNGSAYHHVYGGSSGGHIGDIVVGSSRTSSSGDGGVSRGGFGHGAGGEGGGE